MGEAVFWLKSLYQLGFVRFFDFYFWIRDKGIEGYKQLMVNHSAGQYVNCIVHTNGIESVWALLKRGYHGVFHHFSDKHIGRYVDEFVFRLNDGNVKRSTLDRIDSIVSGFSGNRLSYKMLVLM